jgi:hypothetical protein
LKIRWADGGFFLSFGTGRIGRGAKFPPQFGQTPPSFFSTQSRQKVHANVHIIACRRRQQILVAAFAAGPHFEHLSPRTIIELGARTILDMLVKNGDGVKSKWSSFSLQSKASERNEERWLTPRAASPGIG